MKKNHFPEGKTYCEKRTLRRSEICVEKQPPPIPVISQENDRWSDAAIILLWFVMIFQGSRETKGDEMAKSGYQS
jgi:hypothetical protein